MTAPHEAGVVPCLFHGHGHPGQLRSPRLQPHAGHVITRSLGLGFRAGLAWEKAKEPGSHQGPSPEGAAEDGGLDSDPGF